MNNSDEQRNNTPEKRTKEKLESIQEKQFDTMSKEELIEELKHIKDLKLHRLETVNYIPLEECRKRINNEKQKERKRVGRNIRERVTNELNGMGEPLASLKLQLRELRDTPKPAQDIRDRAKNLKNELEELVSKLQNSENQQNETDSKPEEKPEKEDTEKQKEEQEKVTKEIDRKLDTAQKTMSNLEDRIKHMDRINREVSTKLETLESRSRMKKAAIFLGGFLIFVGAVTLTGGVFLAIAKEELSFVYQAFPQFFSSLMVFLGAILLTSGFLHQV